MKNLINQHEKCINILEHIGYFNNIKKIVNEELNGISGTFPRLVKKYKHQLEIYDNCILRLNDRYNNLLNELKTLEL